MAAFNMPWNVASCLLGQRLYFHDRKLPNSAILNPAVKITTALFFHEGSSNMEQPNMPASTLGQIAADLGLFVSPICFSFSFSSYTSSLYFLSHRVIEKWSVLKEAWYFPRPWFSQIEPIDTRDKPATAVMSDKTALVHFSVNLIKVKNWQPMRPYFFDRTVW